MWNIHRLPVNPKPLSLSLSSPFPLAMFYRSWLRMWKIPVARRDGFSVSLTCVWHDGAVKMRWRGLPRDLTGQCAVSSETGWDLFPPNVLYIRKTCTNSSWRPPTPLAAVPLSDAWQMNHSTILPPSDDHRQAYVITANETRVKSVQWDEAQKWNGCHCDYFLHLFPKPVLVHGVAEWQR